MQLYKILEVKHFMQALFQKEIFDTFLVTEGIITTFVTYRIDGQFHPQFFESESPSDSSGGDTGAGSPDASGISYVTWKALKGAAFSLIRGQRTPLKMQLVFRLADYNVEKLLHQSGLPFTTEDIAGLYLNVLFDGKDLSMTTGISMRTFTLDKSLEHTWDEMAARLLKSREIAFEIV